VIAMPDTSHVIIVGAGFAGVACAKRLAGDSRVRVTVLDRAGYHQFQPLLYQVATAELTAEDVVFDLARVFGKHPNIDARTAEAASVDPASATVTLTDGQAISGDVLVLAAGSQPNFFHTPGAAEYAYPLYSVEDARRIRSRIVRLFHLAAQRPELVREGALTFVVVGGGPTGVETAGALAELVYDVMPHRHQPVATAGARVILVELARDVLVPFSDQAHAYAAKQLQRRGVELRLGVSATEVGPDHISLNDGTTIKTQLVTAGIDAFLRWAEEFYLRPHHRSAELLEPSKIDRPRIDWSTG